MRGFTTIAEQLKDDPEQLTTLINRLLTPLSDIVLARGGTIDKYIGDCLMAFWNAPLESSDMPFFRLSAALDMLEAMDALKRTLEADAKAQGRRHFRFASASASTPAIASWGIWDRRPASIIRCWATRSISPPASKARPTV